MAFQRTEEEEEEREEEGRAHLPSSLAPKFSMESSGKQSYAFAFYVLKQVNS